jgi:phosphoserine phosphatase
VRFTAILWDFDGTLLPYDSEQALLLSLSDNHATKIGWLKARWGRALAWADNHGYLSRQFKDLYVRCLRGLADVNLDALAREIAPDITADDRQAVERAHALGVPMYVVSCGTGDLSHRVLQASGLADRFVGIEANWFTYWEHRIEGMDLVIHSPEDKLAAAERLGVDLATVAAIGDGITDVPLLDRAGLPILLDTRGRHAELAARKGYRRAASLSEVATLLETELDEENAPRRES